MIEYYIGVYHLPHTCDPIMDELDKWIYDVESDQTTIYILDRLNKVPQITKYKQ